MTMDRAVEIDTHNFQLQHHLMNMNEPHQWPQQTLPSAAVVATIPLHIQWIEQGERPDMARKN